MRTGQRLKNMEETWYEAINEEETTQQQGQQSPENRFL